jgi:hypothetical protein
MSESEHREFPTRPLPFTLYPNRGKTVLVLVVCLAFVAVDVLLIHDRTPKYWFTLILFSLAALVMLVQLLPGSGSLTVSRDGIEVRSLFRTHRYRWSELSEFGVYRVRGNTFVGFNFSPEYRRSAAGRALARAFAGYEGSLPESFGLRAQDLAALLAYHHSQWVGR